MEILKIVAWTIVILYAIAITLLYTLQTRLIFYPGRLSEDYEFDRGREGEEFFLDTADGARINGLFFGNVSSDVILYFHGNAGDLSGWQYVVDDFAPLGYNFLIIDYRGYGKSSGRISEEGFYDDAETAFNYLLRQGFAPENIIVYGRSIGSGVAVDLASKKSVKGLILESPFASLSSLANEKFPLFFPSLFIRFRFDNVNKINKVHCPVIFLHGSDDTLIPPSHSRKLFEAYRGKKKMIFVEKGSHNDLHAFSQFEDFLKDVLPVFF